MAGLLKEIRDLPTANSVTAGLGDYLHIKQGDVDRKITVGKVLEPHTSILSGNPHNVTKAEVGLGLVTNDPQLKIASNLNDLGNKATARTNLDVFSKGEVTTAIEAHSTRVDNPHSVTKAQVGLGSVNNYGISDSANLNSSTTYASSKAVKTVFDLIDNADTSNAVFKTGMIMMWDSPTPPAGWELLGGMTDRFPVGAGSSYAYGDTGGTNSNTHNHSFSGHSTALNWTQIPPHQHASWGVDTQYGSNFGLATVYGTNNRLGSGNSDYNNTLHLTSSRIFLGSSYQDGAAGHSHGGTVGSTNLDNRPPYFGVYFIRKL